MARGCVQCGASADLERGVLFDDETARACMACGAVRVNELETVYSDNPHVDPEIVAKPVSLEAEALAWVAAFPRRTRSGKGFLPADVRATTKEALERVEAEADAAALATKGSLADRLRAAHAPADPPPKIARGMDPFRRVHGALALSASSPLVSALLLAEGGSIAGEIAREWLAARRGVLAEVAASFSTLRPANAAVAIAAARATATREEAEALAGAIRKKLEVTDPHSSDVAELRAMLRQLQ